MEIELTAETEHLYRLAAKIHRHLSRMEAEDAQEGGAAKYDHPISWVDLETGKIAVAYMMFLAKEYGPTGLLTEAEAQEYLAWLDAGNSGPHYHMKEPWVSLIRKHPEIFA